MADALLIVGLILNMAGVAFAFFVGFPQPEFRGAALLLEQSPSSEELDRQRRRRRRLSYLGLALLLAGFVLQLAGVLVDD